MSFATVVERLRKLENPYPGLRPFEPQESHLFFGRGQQVAELVGRLERNRFVAVLGVSGSGKSSLVRAGLIPALERGRVSEAGKRWRMVVTRPAGAPFDSLGADLGKAGLDPSPLRRSSHGLIEIARQLPQEEALLVVVDQFEELFRYKDLEPHTEEARLKHDASAADAAEFVQLLLAASRHQPPVFVVLTMRSDYLGDCAEFRDLPETLNDCQYLVPRMTREERKEAIEGPLGRVEVAPSLVQRMLNDAGDEPDQLPILQHALMRTWNHWRKADPEQKRRIELQDYEAIGGFESALNRHADELLEGVPPKLAAAIFKRLTARGRGKRERRDPAMLSELWALCEAETLEQQIQVTAVIDHFRGGEATFLTPRDRAIGPDTYIDITHESLIRQWKKLREEWLPDEQRSAKTFLDLAERARNWKVGKGELLIGLDLADAMEWGRMRNESTKWATHYSDEATLRTVLEFVGASHAEDRRRTRRAKRSLWTAIAFALAFAGLAAFALWARDEANGQRSVSLSRQLTAQSVLLRTEQRFDPQPSALLAIESMLRFPTSEGHRAIRESVTRLPRQVAAVPHQGPVIAAAFSADGQWVATGSTDKIIRVFEAASGNEVWRNELDGTVSAVAFSADGRWAATSSEDKTARVFEARSGKQVWRSELDGIVNAVAFSADGQWVTTSGDKTVRVFEAASGKEVWYKEHDGIVHAVDLSADGQWVATGSDESARVFELASGKEVWRQDHDGTVHQVDLSAAGQWVATSSGFVHWRVFKVASGKELSCLDQDIKAPGAMAFSADGRWVATGRWVRTGNEGVCVFDASSGKEVSILRGAFGPLAFSADGRLVATGGNDSRRLFDTVSGGEIWSRQQRLPFGVESPVAFSADGRWLYAAGTSFDGSFEQVFETASGAEVSYLTHPRYSVRAVVFGTDGRWLVLDSYEHTAKVFEVAGVAEVARLSDDDMIGGALSVDGRWVVAGGLDKAARVIEIVTGKEVSRLSYHGPVYAVAFSPDGQWAIAGAGAIARVFDVASGIQVSHFEDRFPVSSVAVSGNGRWVATGSASPDQIYVTEEGLLRVFEAGTWREASSIPLEGRVRTVALSADGRRVASGGSIQGASDMIGGFAWVFEATTGKLVSRLEHQAPVKTITFSPDGLSVATDGGVFETASGREVIHFVSREGVSVQAVAFSSDGRLVATGSSDGTVRILESATGKDVAWMVSGGSVERVRFEEQERYLLAASRTFSFDSKTEFILTRNLLLPQDLVEDACSRVTRNLTEAEWTHYVGPEVPYHETCPKPQ